MTLVIIAGLPANPDCETCRGRGWIEVVVPECCGRVAPNGECRSHCAIPIEAQEDCPECATHAAESGVPNPLPPEGAETEQRIAAENQNQASAQATAAAPGEGK